MIIEQNVPSSIRNWAYCLVKINRYREMINSLDSGGYFDAATGRLRWKYGKLYGNKGTEKYLEEYCKPESARLKRRCARYRVLADRIQQKSRTSPRNWLLSNNEALSMIGSTLHYARHGKSQYETLKECSEDGEQIYGSIHDLHGLRPLTLLSLGFGKFPK